MAGHPSKFTPGRRTTILNAMRKGHYLKHAAALAGITDTTAYDWINRGKADAEAGLRTAYAKFVEDLAMAEAEGVEYHVDVIQQAGDARVSIEFLSRRHPDEYAKRERHEVTGKDGGPVVVELQWPQGPQAGT